MYGKFFQSTFTGSMVGAGADVFAVWGFVIAHTVSGSVELNPALLKVIIGISEKRVQNAIDYLCAPDESSRSKAEEGRRLVKEGQFSYRVVNHESYKSIRNQDERREYNRLKKQEERRRSRVSTDVNDKSTCQPRSAHTDTEAEEEKTKEARKRAFPADADEEGWKKLASTLGLKANPGEDWASFKQRIRRAAHGRGMVKA